MSTNNNTDNLPTLDDFTESSLLDAVSSEEELDEQEEQEEQEEEESKGPLNEAEESEEEEEEEEKPKKKKTAKKPEASAEEEDDDDSEESEESDDETEVSDNFWTDVENITGFQVDVDYGDTDPESPEGAALREAALVEQVEAGIWKTIQEKFPKSYKALTLEANGGDLSQLITPDYVDYSKIELAEDNEAQQKKILMDYYMEVKNLSEAKAKRMVEADEDGEEEDSLYNAAKEALEERKELQKKREDAILAEQAEKKEKQRKSDEQLLSYVKSVTEEGKIGKFRLANPKEKEDFFTFFASTINHNPNGGYMFAMPLSNDNFNQVMEQAYFAFKGGKLDDLIKRRATTESTQRVKRKLKRSDKKHMSSSSETEAEVQKRQQQKQLPTMNMFETE